MNSHAPPGPRHRSPPPRRGPYTQDSPPRPRTLLCRPTTEHLPAAPGPSVPWVPARPRACRLVGPRLLPFSIPGVEHALNAALASIGAVYAIEHVHASNADVASPAAVQVLGPAQGASGVCGWHLTRQSRNSSRAQGWERASPHDPTAPGRSVLLAGLVLVEPLATTLCLSRASLRRRTHHAFRATCPELHPPTWRICNNYLAARPCVVGALTATSRRVSLPRRQLFDPIPSALRPLGGRGSTLRPAQ